MRVGKSLLVVAAAAFSTGTPTRSPGDAFAAPDYAQLESRAPTPYDLLSSYAFDLILKPIIGRGIEQFLPQSTQVVDLSEKALAAISSIIKEAIDAAWFARDKTKVGILVQNSRDYTRLNSTELQIITSLAVATDFHEEANLIINFLSLYGLQAAPSVQAMIGIYTAFKKEEIALVKDLDILGGSGAQNHLIKFQGFHTRLGELITQLKNYNTTFDRLPSSLFRTRQTETGEYSCPGCICKKRSHTAYFESRPNPSSEKWTTVRKIQQTWPYCGKRPSSKINAHMDTVKGLRDEAVAKYKVNNRDEFLTSGFDQLVQGMENIRTWDVERLITSLFVEDGAVSS